MHQIFCGRRDGLSGLYHTSNTGKVLLSRWRQGRALGMLLPAQRLEGLFSWASTGGPSRQGMSGTRFSSPAPGSCWQEESRDLTRQQGQCPKLRVLGLSLHQDYGCSKLLSAPANDTNIKALHSYDLHCASLASRYNRVPFPKGSKPSCAGTGSGSCPGRKVCLSTLEGAPAPLPLPWGFPKRWLVPHP